MNVLINTENHEGQARADINMEILQNAMKYQHKDTKGADIGVSYSREEHAAFARCAW